VVLSDGGQAVRSPPVSNTDNESPNILFDVRKEKEKFMLYELCEDCTVIKEKEMVQSEFREENP